MRLAIVDTETGGLDPAVDPLLEVGMVIWSVPHRSIVACSSRIIRNDGTNAAEHINRIPAAMLDTSDADERHFAMRHFDMLSHDCVMAAHNAPFDQGFLPEFDKRTWLDTKADLEWPGATLGASLNETSLQLLGYATRGHRALADCLTIARLLERTAQMIDGRTDMTFESWLTRGLRPKATYINADTTYDLKANDRYKAAGFRWNLSSPCPVLPPGQKSWWRRMAKEDVAGLPFAVREVQ